MPHHDPARATTPDELAALAGRLVARFHSITFDKDDADSIRAAAHAVRQAIEVELWPYRESSEAIRLCREWWEDMADMLLAYGHRAWIRDRELRQMMQWRPAPWYCGDLRKWLRLGPRGLTLRVAARL